MAKGKRRSITEMIEFHVQTLKQLKQKQKENNKVTLDKNSNGVMDAITALTMVATSNKVTLGEVIKLIASVKKTGLRIQDPVKKTRTPKTVQVKPV